MICKNLKIKKINWLVLTLLTIIVIFSIPIFFNMVMNFYISNFDYADITRNTWINFFGNYYGGILGASVGGVIAYKIAKFQIDLNNQNIAGKEKREKQYEIFKNLIVNSAEFVNDIVPSIDFVKAYNLIPLEFPSNKIIKDIKVKFDTLLSNKKIDFTKPEDQQAFARERDEILTELLNEMGKILNFEINEEYVKSLYYPSGYKQSIDQINKTNENLNNFLEGKSTFSIKIVKPDKE